MATVVYGAIRVNYGRLGFLVLELSLSFKKKSRDHSATKAQLIGTCFLAYISLHYFVDGRISHLGISVATLCYSFGQLQHLSAFFALNDTVP